MRISDWSSDVCSSDLLASCGVFLGLSALTVSSLRAEHLALRWVDEVRIGLLAGAWIWSLWLARGILRRDTMSLPRLALALGPMAAAGLLAVASWVLLFRSEEHTSELQSLMRTSYAVFCL